MSESGDPPGGQRSASSSAREEGVARDYPEGLALDPSSDRRVHRGSNCVVINSPDISGIIHGDEPVFGRPVLNDGGGPAPGAGRPSRPSSGPSDEGSPSSSKESLDEDAFACPRHSGGRGSDGDHSADEGADGEVEIGDSVEIGRGVEIGGWVEVIDGIAVVNGVDEGGSGIVDGPRELGDGMGEVGGSASAAAGGPPPAGSLACCAAGRVGAAAAAAAAPPSPPGVLEIWKELSWVDRLLPAGVLAAMVLGVLLSVYVDGVHTAFEGATFEGVSVPLAVGLMVMVAPPLCAVRWEELGGALRAAAAWESIALSCLLNWIVGPFLMLGLAWAALPDLDPYRTGIILVGLARCVGMVLIWNGIARGDQELGALLVVVNSLFQIAAYAPMATLFIQVISGDSAAVDVSANAGGAASPDGSSGDGGSDDRSISYVTVARSVGIFLGIPLGFGIAFRLAGSLLLGRERYETRVLPFVEPWATLGLLYTIIVIFGQQGDQVIKNLGPVFRSFVPLLAYFIIMWTGTFFLTRWLTGRRAGREGEAARWGAALGRPATLVPALDGAAEGCRGVGGAADAGGRAVVGAVGADGQEASSRPPSTPSKEPSLAQGSIFTMAEEGCGSGARDSPPTPAAPGDPATPPGGEPGSGAVPGASPLASPGAAAGAPPSPRPARRAGALVGGSTSAGPLYSVSAAQAFTAASNNFELSLAVATSVYGATSKEVLGSAVGALLEVPVLLIISYASLWLRSRLRWADV